MIHSEAILKSLESKIPPFAIPIRFAGGGGLLIISELEWRMNPEKSQRLALINVRVKQIWEDVQKKKI